MKFPQYLSNKPGGDDLFFDDKSQERLAKAMAKYNCETLRKSERYKRENQWK